MKPSHDISERAKPLIAMCVRDAIADIADLKAPTPLGVAAETCAILLARTFAIGRWLDDEQERRAKFEADVLERLTKLEQTAHAPYDFTHLVDRLAKLEANHRPCRAGGRCEIDSEWGQCTKCGVATAPVGPDPTKPLYFGDGAPAVKRYEPDAAEPEQ